MSWRAWHEVEFSRDSEDEPNTYQHKLPNNIKWIVANIK